MKKLLGAFVLGSLVLSMTACGGNASSESSTTAAGGATTAARR